MAYPVISPAGSVGGSQVTRIDPTDTGTALMLAGGEGRSSRVLQYRVIILIILILILVLIIIVTIIIIVIVIIVIVVIITCSRRPGSWPPLPPW